MAVAETQQQAPPVEPAPAPAAPGPSALESVAKGVAIAGGLALGGFALWKLFQAAVDEDFGSRFFPQSFRDEMREAHVETHGYSCPECGEETDWEDLTLDHVVAWANWGRTSRMNARVRCRRCNGRKSDRNSLLDYVVGRSE